MVRVFIAGILALSVLAGCVAGGRQQISAPFDPGEIAFALSPGSTTVTGQAHFKSQSGSVSVPPFGEPIYLIPRGRYTDELASKFPESDSRADITNFDGRIGAYIRPSIVGQGGVFAFQNVPPGRYYIVVTLTEDRPALIAGYNPVRRSLVRYVAVPPTGTVQVAF